MFRVAEYRPGTTPVIAGIVLSAGASRRMGSPKALLPVRGRPSVEVVVGTLASAGCIDIVLVVGRHAEEIRAAAHLEACRVVTHGGWEAGRTSSIQAGLAALGGDADAVMLALVDMPLVNAHTVAATISAWEAARPRREVAVPTLDGRGGHPILLARSLFPAIAGLGPDAPLRDLLRTRSRLDVPVDDPGIRIDLDTPEDLRHLRAD